jgi:hypothetical protein
VLFERSTARLYRALSRATSIFRNVTSETWTLVSRWCKVERGRFNPSSCFHCMDWRLLRIDSQGVFWIVSRSLEMLNFTWGISVSIAILWRRSYLLQSTMITMNDKWCNSIDTTCSTFDNGKNGVVPDFCKSRRRLSNVETENDHSFTLSQKLYSFP